jgi:hypothetical protein
MMPQQEETFRIQGTKLRSILREKPKNAKVMSQLACLMADHATRTNNPTLREEVIELSKQAIEMMPGKPFGYATLSTASQDYNERM